MVRPSWRHRGPQQLQPTRADKCLNRCRCRPLAKFHPSLSCCNSLFRFRSLSPLRSAVQRARPAPLNRPAGRPELISAPPARRSRAQDQQLFSSDPLAAASPTFKSPDQLIALISGSNHRASRVQFPSLLIREGCRHLRCRPPPLPVDLRIPLAPLDHFLPLASPPRRIWPPCRTNWSSSSRCRAPAPTLAFLPNFLDHHHHHHHPAQSSPVPTRLQLDFDST